MKSSLLKLLCLVAMIALAPASFAAAPAKKPANPAAAKRNAAIAAAMRKKAPVRIGRDLSPEAQHAVAWQAYPKKTAPWMERHESYVKLARQGHVDVLLLGDSITDLWHGQKELWEKYFVPLHAANFGISGDRTENVIYRITHGELSGIQPKVVMLLIGTNNLIKDSPEAIARAIAVIVQTIQARLPQTKILILGIYPRGPDPSNPLVAKMRGNITAVNAIIKHLDDGRNVRYLYFGDKFMAPDGTIAKAMMPDFVHISAVGYQIWADSAIPVIKEMMQ